MAYIAVLDANVLWPQSLRDTLVRLAVHDLYRAAWTVKILDEMAISLVRNGRTTQERIERTRDLMMRNCPHMLVEGYEELIPAMTNDPKDRHVLAAAVRINADAILTFNVKDFPGHACEPYGVEILTPNDFLSGLWIGDAVSVVRVLIEQVKSLKNPPLTVFELVGGLAQHAPEFARDVLQSGVIQQVLSTSNQDVPAPVYRTLSSL
ncbi:MAG: PIN domain-containing protein [Chloroflexota bacterium]|nr:PIN domain-containing protein [Chloroflexota bacterium]